MSFTKYTLDASLKITEFNITTGAALPTGMYSTHFWDVPFKPDSIPYHNVGLVPSNYHILKYSEDDVFKYYYSPTTKRNLRSNNWLQVHTNTTEEHNRLCSIIEQRAGDSYIVKYGSEKDFDMKVGTISFEVSADKIKEYSDKYNAKVTKNETRGRPLVYLVMTVDITKSSVNDRTTIKDILDTYNCKYIESRIGSKRQTFILTDIDEDVVSFIKVIGKVNFSIAVNTSPHDWIDLVMGSLKEFFNK